MLYSITPAHYDITPHVRTYARAQQHSTHHPNRNFISALADFLSGLHTVQRCRQQEQRSAPWSAFRESSVRAILPPSPPVIFIAQAMASASARRRLL